MTDERLTTGYEPLATESSDVPTLVYGVALGEGDVTRGGSGKETLWPRETLEAAADGLEGQPLATDTNHTADGAKPQTPVEAIAGEVTWSGYKPGVGVVYEAEVDDESLAEKIQNGRLEVSPLVSRDVEPLSEGQADYKATDIHRWRDLALVAQGAAPSNSIAPGENPMKAEALHDAIAALQDMTPPEQAQTNARAVLDIREQTDAMTDTGWNRARQLADGGELSMDVIQKMSQFKRHQGNTEYANYSDIPESKKGEDAENPWWEDNGTVAWLGWGGTAGVEWADGMTDDDESMANTSSGDSGATVSNAEALKEVAGVSFEDTDEGELDESEIPNDDYESHYLYPADTKSESSYPVVDADGVLRKGNVDAAHQLGCRGRCDSDDRHDERLMALAGEFDTPPAWADSDDESMGADASNPAYWEACSLDVPVATTQSDDGTHGDGSQSSVADNSDETMTDDELTDTEKAILEAAEDVEAPTEALNEFAATEQAEVVAQTEYEALQENVEEVRDVLSEALSEKTELKDSTIEALSFEALCDEFRNDDGDLQVEALRQVPESGQPDEEPDEGVEALGDDADVEKAEALYQDMQSFGVDHEETICEALGVSDWDTAQEVLN
jgi:hypothetical protein